MRSIAFSLIAILSCLYTHAQQGQLDLIVLLRSMR